MKKENFLRKIKLILYNIYSEGTFEKKKCLNKSLLHCILCCFYCY